MRVQTLGLFINALKPESLALVSEVEAACSAAGLTLLAEPAAACEGHEAESVEAVVRGSDALLVLGGDGTILRAIGCMGDRVLPVLGINLGTLGFLAECAPEELREAVARLAAGDFHLERRMLLEAQLEGDPAVYTALNDVVVTRGSFTRILQADTYVDGLLAARFAGDGSIVASPTGSTAYSLSAGGPVVAPGMDCFVLAPICPHTLSSRTMVVSADSRVRIAFQPRGEEGGMLLSVDGAQCRVLHEKAALCIRRSDRTLPFVRFGEERFFELLRNKLSKWEGEMLLDETVS